MLKLLSRNIEYLVLVALAAGVAYLVVDRYGSGDEGPAARGQGERQTQVPTCSEAGLTPKSTRDVTCRTASATLTIGDRGDTLDVGPLSVRVDEVDGIRATTAAGRRRGRMRVEVRLELRNRADEPYRATGAGRGIYVASAGRRVSSDPAARSLPGALALGKAVPPGASAAGVLRFELAGRATRAILRTRRAELGVRVAEDRVGVVRLRFPSLR